MARQAEEQLHQEDLRRLERQREYEQKRRELEAWRRQQAQQIPPPQRSPDALELPTRPTDLPVILTPHQSR